MNDVPAPILTGTIPPSATIERARHFGWWVDLADGLIDGGIHWSPTQRAADRFAARWIARTTRRRERAESSRYRVE